jgi:hypothetical protein
MTIIAAHFPVVGEFVITYTLRCGLKIEWTTSRELKRLRREYVERVKQNIENHLRDQNS